jgi:hypothetical protein
MLTRCSAVDALTNVWQAAIEQRVQGGVSSSTMGV